MDTRLSRIEKELIEEFVNGLYINNVIDTYQLMEAAGGEQEYYYMGDNERHGYIEDHVGYVGRFPENEFEDDYSKSCYLVAKFADKMIENGY